MIAICFASFESVTMEFKATTSTTHIALGFCMELLKNSATKPGTWPEYEIRAFEIVKLFVTFCRVVVLCWNCTIRGQRSGSSILIEVSLENNKEMLDIEQYYKINQIQSK